MPKSEAPASLRGGDFRDARVLTLDHSIRRFSIAAVRVFRSAWASSKPGLLRSANILHLYSSTPG